MCMRMHMSITGIEEYLIKDMWNLNNLLSNFVLLGELNLPSKYGLNLTQI